nr:hypothetical protein CFP56_34567 [Quercus suber]
MTNETNQNLPPKNQTQIGNRALDNSTDVTDPTTVSSEPLLLVPPMKSKQPIPFDQIMAEIDRDIQCFDRVEPAQLSSKISHQVQTSSHPIGPNISLIPTEIPTSLIPSESSKTGPLNDITNISLAHVSSEAENERKWARIQRPNFLSTDEPLETSLGKRGPLPNLVDTNPLKRRTTSDDDSLSSSSKTAYQKIQAPPSFLGSDAQVSVLIDKDNNSWIEDAIVNNFSEPEAKLIKAIPLSFSGVEDRLCWCGTLNGLYSVKSGYKLLMSEELNSSAHFSPGLLPKSAWRRKVLSDSSCLACGAAQESTLHALWSCPKLLEVWSVHFNPLRREASDVSSFSEVFGLCLNGSHQCELFAMIAYQIWFRRNKLRLGEEVADLKMINSLARAALHEFQHANTAPQKSLPASANVRWVILEGDSETAIRALNSEAFSAAAFGHLISDVKALSSHFRAVVFNHTRRMGNKVAHRLARSACNFSSSFCTWIEEVPVCTFADYSAEIINPT